MHEFLKTLLSNFNVGIWSAANDTHVVDIIKVLEKEAREEFPFFMIWGRSNCQPFVETRITCPDNPREEALFKPLAIALMEDFKAPVGVPNYIYYSLIKLLFIPK